MLSPEKTLTGVHTQQIIICTWKNTYTPLTAHTESPTSPKVLSTNDGVVNKAVFIERTLVFPKLDERVQQYYSRGAFSWNPRVPARPLPASLTVLFLLLKHSAFTQFL